ncbi:hypothetical protein B0T16DRAFT_97510 [Cercophora newfieldiana]|uniref:Transmembrane protein n=1 Tax=Cercophora newfieldiana TaxID=92897 RepID=A0AA40CWY8_9PEZI|nr:hypothetical protein B0T16DRAFT_97510 [Cercophora newfieldiana]
MGWTQHSSSASSGVDWSHQWACFCFSFFSLIFPFVFLLTTLNALMRYGNWDWGQYWASGIDSIIGCFFLLSHGLTSSPKFWQPPFFTLRSGTLVSYTTCIDSSPRSFNKLFFFPSTPLSSSKLPIAYTPLCRMFKFVCTLSGVYVTVLSLGI